MNTLYGLYRLPDVAIVTNLSNTTSKLPGVKEVRNILTVTITCMTSLAGTQGGGRGSGLLSSWNVRSYDQPSEPHPLLVESVLYAELL